MLFTNADITTWIGSLVWPFTRIAAMLAIAPIFGARMVQKRTRLVMALLLTWIVLPLLPQVPAIDPFSIAGALVTAQQMAIGRDVRIMAICDLQKKQRHSVFPPAFCMGGTIPVIGQYYVVVATLLFLALNGHLALIRVLVDSFQTLPVGMDSLGREDFRAIAYWGSRMFSGALMVAIPAIASILLVNLSFGVVSRSAPQLNVFGVGFPITLTLGFVVLVFAVSNLLPQLQHLINDALTSVGQLGNGGQ